MDAGDARQRLEAVIAVKNKRIEELETALREIELRTRAHACDSDVHAVASEALQELPDVRGGS